MKKIINVGEMIARHISENNISKAALARALKLDASGIEYRVKRKDCPASFLLVVSHELKHNFFADIARELPDTYTGGEKASGKEEEIASLKQEIEFLKREKELLASLLRQPEKE